MGFSHEGHWKQLAISPLAGTATCLVYGDLHFVTFDERQISFTGTCTYILTQICDNSTGRRFEPELGGLGSGGGKELRLQNRCQACGHSRWLSRVGDEWQKGTVLDQGPLLSCSRNMYTQPQCHQAHNPRDVELRQSIAFYCGMFP